MSETWQGYTPRGYILDEWLPHPEVEGQLRLFDSWYGGELWVKESDYIYRTVDYNRYYGPLNYDPQLIQYLKGEIRNGLRFAQEYGTTDMDLLFPPPGAKKVSKEELRKRATEQINKVYPKREVRVIKNVDLKSVSLISEPLHILDDTTIFDDYDRQANPSIGVRTMPTDATEPVYDIDDIRKLIAEEEKAGVDFGLPDNPGPEGKYEIDLEHQLHYGKALNDALQAFMQGVVGKYGKTNFWLETSPVGVSTINWERGKN